MKTDPDEPKDWIGPKCVRCDQPPIAYWPAYDPLNSPQPYCQKHLDEARATIPVNTPEYKKLGGWID
jgi:hypothetical protein